jgi:signal transduction histidine kinase
MIEERPLYSSRIILSFVNLLKKKYPQVDLNEVYDCAQMKAYEVSDEGHWFTQSQVDLFHDKVTESLGQDISREAGRFAASGESIGFMGKYVLGLIGPANAFFAIGKATSSFTRSSTYECRRISDNKVEITVTPVDGVEERAFQCENRFGFFEAILMMFQFDIPVIEHDECLFSGGDCCRYIISWKKTTYAKVRGVRDCALPLLLTVCIVLSCFYPWARLAETLPILAVLFFAASYLAEHLEKRELAAALAHLNESTDQLVDQIAVNYNNARMVNEVGQAISKHSDIDEVLENVVKALEKRLGYDRCLILLADQNKSTLRFRAGYGYTERQLKALQQTSFNLGDPDSKGVFSVSFREQRSIFVHDFSELSRSHSPHSVTFSQEMEARSFICCAIVCEGETLGVLAVDNMKTKKKLMQSDMSLLNGIAPVIGMSIRNAMYMEREIRLAEQMRQSQKMEAVGQLAGGVAHDFNNLLTAIIGFVTLAGMNMAKDDPVLKFLEQAIMAADRATNLTQGLLAFSRKQVNNPEPVDLNLIVSNMKKLLLRLITAEIRMELSVSEERLHVVADSGQIDQVIMNLVTNARDAMNGAGVLTIRTAAVEMTEHFVATHGFGAVGYYALLSVSDTGIGIDEATKAHVFEPFFTTKEVGKGTGLGLAIVYGIVQQHDGYLEIETEPDKGTCFKIYLPLLGREIVATPPVEMPEVSYAGTETVLIAEDAPEVRRLTAEVLAKNGYRVIEATDGMDALQKFSDNRNEVDLVIMDVVMPKMNGREAYGEISKISPRVKVLFTSGYTADDVGKEMTFAKENFLPKPCSPQGLLKKVRDMLAA